MERPRQRLARHLLRNKRELVQVLTKARARIRAKIEQMARDPRFGRSGTYRERVFREVGTLYDRLAVDLDRWISELAVRDASSAYEVSRKLLKAKPTDVVGPMDPKVIKRWMELVHPANASSLAALHSIRMKVEHIAALRSTVVSVFREASLGGLTASQIQKTLTERTLAAAASAGPWKFIDSSGREWDPNSYFNMLTRTVTSRVTREGTLDAMEEEGVDLAFIEGGGDPCPICAKWRGALVSVSGTDERFPSVDEAMEEGVFHPNCVCELLPADPSAYKEEIARQAAIFAPVVAKKGAA